MWAQVAPGNVQGKVVAADGEAIPGATVELEGTEFSTVTNQAGEYTLVDVASGIYTLRANIYSHKAYVTEVKVESGQISNQRRHFVV